MNQMIVYCQPQIMISFKLFVNSIFFASSSVFPSRSVRFKFETRAFLKPMNSNSNQEQQISLKSSVQQDSLRVLEWDKVCDSVASFAGTTLGREATKEKLLSLNQSYEESIRLLGETNAAVEMLNHGDCDLEFSGTNVALVKSAILHVSRGEPVDGNEALAVASLLKLSETLQLKVKAAIKQDSDNYNRFMPLSEVIVELVINPSLVKSIQQVVDEDGSVKDSASSSLKSARDQVRGLERKLYQLMDNLIRTEQNKTSSLEMSNIDGRWCVKSGVDQVTNVKGLLLSSGSGVGNLVEPLSAIPLNDELLQARSLVAKAEEVVLRGLAEKIQPDLDDIHNSLNSIIQLDIVTARAKYSLSFGGTFPDLFLTQDLAGYFPAEPDTQGNKTSREASSHPTQREWTLYLPKAYHPLLIQQHRQNLKKARKDVSNAIAANAYSCCIMAERLCDQDIRRRKFQGENLLSKENPEELLASLEMRVSKLEEANPVPVDFFVRKRTRVLVITGPNTGGKTICLKTVGLAALMAKSGLYVLSSEPVRIPWFDAVFADIGDEQSLSQSLSTFSGHLRRISAIQAQSTDKSLVLLDEVGAGTNPLEGAALGMSLLESFAESGAFFTIATTHHGELKTLKYSNGAFENACMEFDEVNLKPTYKILWGIPGSSNAINIAERLGLPDVVIENARELYGTTNAEINQVIIDMEQFKQELQGHIQESHQYISLSRELHGNLLATKQKITEHGTTQRYRKIKEISEAAAIARSTIHKKLRELRASATQSPQHVPVIKTRHDAADIRQRKANAENIKHKANAENIKHPRVDKSAYLKQLSPEKKIPKVGDEVHVCRLGRTATVLEVEASKNEIVVQASNMKLRLKMSEVGA